MILFSSAGGENHTVLNQRLKHEACIIILNILSISTIERIKFGVSLSIVGKLCLNWPTI